MRRGLARRFTVSAPGLKSLAVAGITDHPLFTGLTPQLVSRLVTVAKQLRVPSGTQLLREGELGDGLYIVEEGTVEIEVSLGGTSGRTLAKLGPGDLVGEMAVLEEQPRSAAAVARTDAVVWFLPRQDVLDMIRECPDLALRLLRELSRRLRQFNRLYLEQTLQMERLALLGGFSACALGLVGLIRTFRRHR